MPRNTYEIIQFSYFQFKLQSTKPKEIALYFQENFSTTTTIKIIKNSPACLDQIKWVSLEQKAISQGVMLWKAHAHLFSTTKDKLSTFVLRTERIYGTKKGRTRSLLKQIGS